MSEPAARDYARIYAFIRRRTTTAEEAEDATQEVFARAARAFRDAENTARTPTLAWLYKVARNHLIDLARRRATTPDTVSLERLENELESHDSDYGSEVARVLRRTYERLPATQRDAVRLRLIEGHSFAEVAEKLGIAEGAAKMRVQRALETMRDAFEREGLEP